MTSLINRVWLAALVLLLGTQLATAQELVTYFHTDAAGSPVAATDANGNVVWREDYQPYGERRTYDLSGGNNRSWFTGQPHSDEYGLTYLGARYYDPVVGRFMGIDPQPVSEPYLLGFNRYAYANNNPYAYKDPDGEFANFVFGGLKAAIENAVIQRAEMALGLRTEFSWSELAVDTAIGTATSGLSTLKNAGRLGTIAVKIANKADEGANAARAAEGAFSRILSFTPRQLQKGFTKHGADFGLTGNWNPSRAAEFSAAVNKHISSPGVQTITGSYRGQLGFVHHLDPKTGLNVVSDLNGNFVTGFRLHENQLSDLIATGGFR